MNIRHQYIHLKGAQPTYQAVGIERIFLPRILQTNSNSPVLNTAGLSLIESGLVIFCFWGALEYPLFLAPAMMVIACRVLFKQFRSSHCPPSASAHKFVSYHNGDHATADVVSSFSQGKQQEFFSSQTDNNSNSQVIFRR
ncbi:MAG: hypothetical protein ACI38Q_07720 [Candidatus Bruticola sp.]